MMTGLGFRFRFRFRVRVRFRLRVRVRVRVEVLSLSDTTRWPASPATPSAASIEIIVRPAVVSDEGVVVEPFHLRRLGDYLFSCRVHGELDPVRRGRLFVCHAAFDRAKSLKRLPDLCLVSADRNASKAKQPVIPGRSGRDVFYLKHSARRAELTLRIKYAGWAMAQAAHVVPMALAYRSIITFNARTNLSFSS